LAVQIVDIAPGDLDFSCLVPTMCANKYTRGKLTIVGGCAGFPGAAILAAGASVRSGSGYTQVVCAPESVALVQGAWPSVVARAWRGWSAGACALDAPARPGHPQACLVGCGMNASDDFQAWLVQEVCAHVAVPRVIDGGAITIYANLLQAGAIDLFAEGDNVIFTPHFGEAARLARAAGIDTPSASSHVSVLARFCADLSCVLRAAVVLKGPQTFICAPCAPQVVFRENFATPALAKAGTGDILAGIIASFLAQGQSVKGAAILGVGAHSLAGRAAEQKFGTISAAPEDAIASLSEVFMQNIN
jgi:hydroxyethylthiazole kinase-like uncharacterized protein yjeF